MKGGIHTEERCPVCEGKFRDTGKSLVCPTHPKQKASGFRVYFGLTSRRFNSYEEADRFLTGLRFKMDEKTFDVRDYQKGAPLSFENLTEKWLSYHLNEVRAGSRKNILAHMRRAKAFFGNQSVKEIRFADLEDFIHTTAATYGPPDLSDKSKHNIVATLHAFFMWAERRQVISRMPQFPIIHFDLGYRRTIDKETQQTIIAKIRELCPNPKVYLGIRWLATYIALRPGELIKLQEGNIDAVGGFFAIPAADSKTIYKAIPLIPEDIEILKRFTFSPFPATPFFRHTTGTSGVKEDVPFGEHYFHKWWVRACEALGIEGVDLYGGTRHSSVRDLIAQNLTPEQVKIAAMSGTNKAFERYMGKAIDSDLRAVYQRSAKVVDLARLLPDNKTGEENQ